MCASLSPTKRSIHGGALRAVPVPHHAVAAVRQLLVLHAGQEGRNLGLDRLGQQLAGTGAQHLGQGIVNLAGLTQPDDSGSLAHGVSLSLGDSGGLVTRLDTPPFSGRHHPDSAIALIFEATAGCL